MIPTPERIPQTALRAANPRGGNISPPEGVDAGEWWRRKYEESQRELLARMSAPQSPVVQWTDLTLEEIENATPTFVNTYNATERAAIVSRIFHHYNYNQEAAARTVTKWAPREMNYQPPGAAAGRWML